MQIDVEATRSTRYLPIPRGEHNLTDMDLRDHASDSLFVAEPSSGGAIEWLAENRGTVMAQVQERGWALIRGLGIADTTLFRNCVKALDIPLIESYGDLPMMPSDDGTTGVFNVTKYPAQNAILFHNEGSHTGAPPRHISFQCSIAAQTGGETPISDIHEVLLALPEEIRSAFASRGLLYKRHFIPGLDVTWQRYFGTSDHDAVEKMCAAQNIVVRWRNKDDLETETFRPAVINHPTRDIKVFFNQMLLHHPSCLDSAVRSGMEHILKGDSFPRNVCFGDGETIPDEWIAEVLRAHLRVAKVFHWRPGDMVVADNHAVAHARRPYSGPRKHHVILGCA